METVTDCSILTRSLAMADKDNKNTGAIDVKSTGVLCRKKFSQFCDFGQLYCESELGNLW